MQEKLNYAISQSRLTPQHPSSFGSFEEAVAYCVQLHESGDWQAAEKGYEQLLQQRPGIPDLLRLRGLALAQLGRPEEGLPFLQDAVRLAPQQSQSHLHLGFVLRSMGRNEQAQVYFREASRLAPSDPAPRVNLVAVLVDLEKFQEAVAVGRKAASLAPEMAEAQHNLGYALLNNKEAREALVPLRRAVQLQPGFAEAWLHLGLAYAALERLDDAALAYRRCLQIDPLHTPAANNLANLWQRRGDSESAVALYRQILSREPQRWETRLSMALALADLERWSEAIQVAEGVTPPAHRERDYRYFRINMLIDQGRQEDARTLLDLEKKIDLQYWLARANVIVDPVETDDLLLQIENSFSQGALKDQIRAAFLLGDTRHRHQDFSTAFSWYSQGHALLNQAEPYDHESWLATLAEDKVLYQQMHPIVCSSVPSPQPVFIVGMPRSGTSLLEQVLDSHPQVVGAGELPDMARFAATLRQEANPGPDLLLRLRDQYLERLRQVSGNARYVTDKMPHNFAHLGLIALLFPQAPILYCQRDPRDNALSIWRQNFTGNHAYSHDLINMARHYQVHLQLLKRGQEEFPNPFLQVYYERLVEDFAETVGAVLNLLELPWDDACLRFYENPRKVRTASRDQVNKPLYRSSLGSWRAYAQQLQPFTSELQSAGIILES